MIDAFLAGSTFAVIGASTNRTKFGNKVLRAYLAAGLDVHVVHPREREIEGIACVPTLADLPPGIDGLSVITPPAVTERVVEDAAAAGITKLWLQPGAESDVALSRAAELGLDVLAGGPCILVELPRRSGAG